jgi:hypothetical protein
LLWSQPKPDVVESPIYSNEKNLIITLRHLTSESQPRRGVKSLLIGENLYMEALDSLGLGLILK